MAEKLSRAARTTPPFRWLSINLQLNLSLLFPTSRQDEGLAGSAEAGSTGAASGAAPPQAHPGWAVTSVNRAGGGLRMGRDVWVRAGWVCSVPSHGADGNCLHPFAASPLGGHRRQCFTQLSCLDRSDKDVSRTGRIHAISDDRYFATLASPQRIPLLRLQLSISDYLLTSAN